jgi:parallel beta-helix repeat protein
MLTDSPSVKEAKMRRATLSLLVLVSAGLFLLPTLVPASQMAFTFDFDLSDLVFEKVSGYDQVRMADARFPAEPGTPSLPVRFVQIAIPADLHVEKVKLVFSEHVELGSTYKLYPAQQFYPVSDLPTKEEQVEFVQPDPAVYALNTEYPGELASVTNNGYLGGQHIAGVALYPLQYVPSEGKLILYTRIEFQLVLKPSLHLPVPVNRRSENTARFYSNLAKSVVINPEAVQLETKGSVPKNEELDYLIITDDSMVSTFQELADWKIRKGISTEVRRIAWVISNYEGYDDQEKVRNCIKDYYSNHGTKWVLLGGDTPIMPHRVAPVMGENIPCDFYFSDLDGNWDANGNHIYGEYLDEVDMYPDVFVGRAPSNNVTQAETFVEKCLTYETSPTTDYLTRVLYAAEVLWPVTDAAVLKNYIDDNFLPDHFTATKLYQTSGNLNRNTFRDGLNAGQNIINHAGHGNFDVLSLGGDAWFNEDMDALINAPRYSLFYTFGCITAAIDYDCIAERFVNNPNGGGFGYCGNTRYGWGTPGNPLGGPGSEFDIEFFRAVFDSANYQIGRALGNSKIPFIPIAQEPENVYRWTMYTLLLLGDPTLELWTDTPAELTVSHAPVFFAGMSYFDVNVVQDSAFVSCVKDGEVLGTAYSSGGSVAVIFDAPLVSMGTMHVTVTKHDYMPYHDTVVVIPPEGPYVIYWSHEIDDSQGNNNGVVNPDETILMSITAKNIGIEDAQGVSATLREDDPYVVVTDSVKSFGDIDSGMTAVSIGDYVLEISASCPDSHVVEFNLEATDGDTSWVTSFWQMVVEPDFIITAIPDTAVVHQGDSCFVKLILTSVGGFNWPVDLSHTALPSGVSGIIDPAQLVPTDSSVFRIYAEPDVPPQVQIITITASGGEITREKEIVLGVAPPPYYGPLWHVSTGGNDLIGNGTEEFPFRTIQKGINSASDGDTVLAESGTYVENINFSGKGILVASRFIFDQQDSTISATIIDGNYEGSVVTFDSGEDSTAVIRGFTITKGYTRYGSGVRCLYSSPTIMENFIVRDSAEWGWSGGAGVYCWDASPKIYRNVIAENTGPATIFLYGGSNARVTNNTVCNNAWGGISVQNSAVYAKNNIFYGNVSYGIHISASGWDISYNDVYGQDENYAGVGDQTGINGNISADPLFVNPSAGDYHLASGSPCIDAGDPADSVPPGGGERVDMGALELIIEGPWVVYSSHQIDDSAGNDNGVINPGETISMPVMVFNNGIETAYELTGILKTNDSFVAITDSLESFGDIEAGGTAWSHEDYAFEVDPSCPDSHEVVFTLETFDAQTSWFSSFSVMVVVVDFTITAIPETTLIVQGFSGVIKLILTSHGGFNSPVELSHSALPPEVTGEFDPDQVVPTDSSDFILSVGEEASPWIHPITITAEGGEISHDKEVVLRIVGPGRIWHVSVDGDNHTGDGSEESPFRTIQKGISMAYDRDTVLVNKGRYVENTDFLGKAILLASHYIRDDSEDTIDSTIIDGNDSGSVVTFQSGEGSGSVIRGFTLTGGYAQHGGGIFCLGSSPTISRNFIVQNECGAGEGGCGIYCGYGSDARISRNLVANCVGPVAIFLYVDCNGEIVNNTVVDNTWGGISVQGGSYAYIKNNIVCGNNYDAYGIHAAMEGSCYVAYNDVYGHTDNYAGTILDQTGINGNISTDPLFVDAPSGDYHLIEISPCIDAGDPPGTDMGAFECLVGTTFVMSVAPDTAVVDRGDSTFFEIILTSVGGFDSPVDLSYSALPSGVTGVFDPDQLVPTGTSFFRIHATPDADPGFHRISIVATGGEVTREKEVVLVVQAPYYGPVWYVSVAGHDVLGSGSEQLPFGTIQKGIDVANSGDTVLVEKGTYQENINFCGKAIVVGSRFIFHGFECDVESTIIRGAGGGPVVSFDYGEEDSNSVIRGFTITGGSAGYGGGIWCSVSSPTIVDNLIIENSAIAGPAICCRQSNANIYRNLIADCSGPAAIFVWSGGSVRLINNTVCDNDGGGLSIQYLSTALVKNNIFFNNAPYGIHSTNMDVDIQYNDVYGNTLNYEGIPDQTGINGNISADPLFVNASAGDYHLAEGSPCIDTGDPLDPVPPGGGDRVDMGAFEYLILIAGDANGDGQITAEDVVYLINYLFRGGPPPYVMEAGDANGDGEVNAADVVYLIQYLFHGGPPPRDEAASALVYAKNASLSPASLWLSHASGSYAGGKERIILQGSFEVDLAAVQLAIEYDPEELNVIPVLPAQLRGLSIYSSQQGGVLKVGVLDLRGEKWIGAGSRVDLLVLEAKGADLSSLKINQAILVDRDACIVPVKVLSGEDMEEIRPESFSLSQNYPNPFNPQTQILYGLPVDCQVKITIYNLLGRRVKTLADEPQTAGYKRVHWDGKDERGVEVASGIYFYKIQAGEFVQTKKMLLLK